MEDSTAAARELVRGIIMSKTVEERFLMCAALYDDALELAKIGMPEGLSQSEQRDYVFRRLHGTEPEKLVAGE